ncbi:condensation domain-containing protein [Actinomadura macra]|uniref:condensation domain-containing protein n=1 Tax=Actinomadura macra TaxID=46164 RepID=UPI00082E8E26|nr:condensation domain-containing protein [Actinomadura macra]
MSAVVESPQRLAVHVALPHAVADFASIGIVTRDLLTAYAALVKGERPVLPEARQFADHLRQRRSVCDDERTWREGGPGARAAAFWARKLHGVEPSPFERPPRGGTSGERMVFVRGQVDGETRRLLEEICAQQRCSLFHATLAAFEETVAGLTGEPDVTTMCIVHGRGGGEFQDTVGLLISDIVFRRHVGAPSRRAALSAVATDAWVTHMHQDIRVSELSAREDEVKRIYRERHFRAMYLQFRPQQIGAGMENTVDGVRLSFPSVGADVIRLPGRAGFAPHTHPGHHVLAVLAGIGTITYGGQVHRTEAGQIYLVEGEVPHAVGAISDHLILAVGAPHKPVDSAERMDLVPYTEVLVPDGDLDCLICEVSARLPGRLHSR